MNIEKDEMIGGHLLRPVSGTVTGGALHQKKDGKPGAGRGPGKFILHNAPGLNKIIKAATFRSAGSKAFVFLQGCFLKTNFYHVSNTNFKVEST